MNPVSRLFSIIALIGLLTSLHAKPNIVLISGEYEYKSAETLPPFAKWLGEKHGFNCVYLERPADKKQQRLAGLQALKSADLAIFYIRRMTLPDDEIALIRKYTASGKPIIGLRTASHAFENWKEWDQEVLGGNYQGHHPATLKTGAKIAPGAEQHPILAGVAAGFATGGSLYRNTPLRGGRALLLGSAEGKADEPVAWTHECRGAKVFYTSLGHPDDFANDNFRRLLVNAIHWCLEKTAAAPVAKVGHQRVEVDEFNRLWTEKKLTVLDVRTPKEFADGHLPGAVNIDFYADDFIAQLGKLDKSRAYLIHCRSGGRSGKAGEMMQKLGFPAIYDLAPGMIGWQKAGKPVEK